MPVPVVSSSNPASSAVDVFTNVPLYVTFASPGLLSSSVTQNSVMLYNVATQSVVPVTLSYDSSTRVVTITPLSVLAESSVYSIRFPGTDIALGASYVIKESGSGTALITTIDIQFTTGTRTYINDTVVDKNASDLSLEGDLRLPVNVKALGDLAVETTYPKNHTADVSGQLDGSNRFYVKFNKALSGTVLTQDWATINAFPMMDMNVYLASGTTFGTGTMPIMTGIWASGAYLWAGFSAELPKNAAVQMTLSEDIVATDGTELGPNQYMLSFTTDRFPKVGGVNIIKTELAATADVLNNEYIASILLKNTVRIIQRWPSFNQTVPQYIAYKYIINRTIVDILDDKELEKALVAGTRRRLGDFDVSIDYKVGQLALKHARALKEADDALDGIDPIKKLGARIDTAIALNYQPDRLWHGVSNRIIDLRFKTYQEDIPASNQSYNRHAKTQNYPF